MVVKRIIKISPNKCKYINNINEQRMVKKSSVGDDYKGPELYEGNRVGRFFGWWKYKLRYSPRFYAVVWALFWWGIAAALFLVGAWVASVVCAVFGLFSLVIGAQWKKMDISEDANYCRRLHPKWSDQQILECVDNRENVEAVRDGDSHYFWLWTVLHLASY